MNIKSKEGVEILILNYHGMDEAGKKKLELVSDLLLNVWTTVQAAPVYKNLGGLDIPDPETICKSAHTG